MSSLAEITEKYKQALKADKKQAKNVQRKADRLDPFADTEERDQEWEDFFDHVKNNRDQVLQFLLETFQGKSKEINASGKCVEYLKKLLVRTHKLLKSSRTVVDAATSISLIFRNLFDLAQANWSLPSQVVDDMMGVAINAIRDYPSGILAKYVVDNALKEMAQEENLLSSRWIEMFAKFIVVLSDRGDIPSESDIIDGKSFKELIVHEICRMDWSKPVFRSYLNVLEEMSGLDGYEIDTIVQKFGCTLKKMSPNFIHSSIAQIIAIAGNLRPAIVLKIFDDYFISLQETQNKQPQEAPQQKRRFGKKNTAPKKVSLGIVACNFVDASRHCDAIIRELLKRVKASMFDHSLVTTPFMLTVILAMTNVDYLRIPFLDPLKTTILKSFHELNLCKSSFWYREVIGEAQGSVIDSFKYVLKESTDASDYMMEGLKDLGINLLNSGSLQWKYPRTFSRCRELGALLVNTVVMTNKEQLGFLLKELLKPDSSAHIECLATCLSQCSRSLGHRDFYGRISELLHHLPSMSVESASPIVKALLPSLYMSPNLFDDLMIILRKTFWKSIEAGRICVEIMCVILSNTYVSGNTQIFEAFGQDEDLIFSQCTQGAGSSARASGDHSSMCTELLHLAKRFFLLDCRVREQMYLGLHRVARRNPMLNDIIAGQLYAHASQYLIDDSECLIKFASLFEFFPLKDKKVSLKEELGFLVQCMGFVYSKTNDELRSCPSSVTPNNNADDSSHSSCKDILNKLIEFVSTVEVNQLELVASAILGESELSPEDRSTPQMIRFVKVTICMQTMQIIEALIEFLSWNPGWSQGKQKVSRMFRKYLEVDKYLKEKPSDKKVKGEKGKKPKAKPAKKKGDTTRVTHNDTASVVSGSASTAATGKAKRATILIKVPPHFYIINLDSVVQMLREIYGPETQSKPLKSMRGSDEFELMLLKTVKNKVVRLKAKESIRERQRAPGDSLNSLTCLIEAMWKRLLVMHELWKNESEVDENTAVVEARLDIISNVLEFFYNEGQHARVLHFNHYRNQTDDEVTCCENIFEECKNVLELSSTLFDGIQGKGNPSLFWILDSVCKAVSDTNVLSQVQDWNWKYLKENVPDQEGSAGLLEAAVNLFLTCNKKCMQYSSGTHKDCLKMAKAVCRTLGSIDGKHEEHMVSWLINKDTAPILLCCIANYAEGQLGMLSTILGRLKTHRQYLGNERSTVIRESCFTMIDSLRQISTELVRSHLPSGPCSNQMLKLVTQLYSVLSSFAEHLTDLHKHGEVDVLSFKKIVSFFGKDFKPRIEKMISTAEADQRKQIANQPPNAKKSKITTAILNQFSKDAKLIPNMVYHIERFDQFLIALSKKVKIDLLVGMKLSTARDFRIEASRFQKAIREQNESIRPDSAESIPTTSRARPVTAASTASTSAFNSSIALNSTSKTSTSKNASKLSKRKK